MEKTGINPVQLESKERVHMKNAELTRVLVEDTNEQVLKKMQLWFRKLREAC